MNDDELFVWLCLAADPSLSVCITDPVLEGHRVLLIWQKGAPSVTTDLPSQLT